MNISQDGQGPTVVLSHALALDRHMWDELTALLAPRYRVVRYDHRGHGQGPNPDTPYTIDDLADDAAAVIRSVSSAPVVFAGLSLGGMVGQALAARHPSLLRGLAVINSAPHYADRTLWDTRIQAVRTTGMPAVAEASIDRWLTPAFRQSTGGQAVVARLRQSLLDTDSLGYVRACEAIAAMDLRPGNRRITTPTLIVAGRHDLATPLAQSQAIAADIAGARIVEVEAAHISAAECPDELARVLDEWMRTLPAVAG
ncbi:MAG TPA: alpha/beta fold hydrolase [Hydrogenophaga sp.]|uniref:alpha/beta fold hydrolase n=1 Tax=Hydrogenophaga sp. TaxID=1904254 RepID=UPI002BB2707D|nr:alpha/beta fold hydrolase [Hydrogenophaga sp.]HSX91977.1 alpha/beta fold hydrolase [Hydrogenophaga sp.]